MSAIPHGTTHLEVHESGTATFWSIGADDDGTGEFWQGGRWIASEISSAFMQRLVEFKQPSSPIRVVADISGGALHGVYAEVPVRVLFISDDGEDIASQMEELNDDEMRKDTDGRLVASWLQASGGGADAEVVQHYFEQE